MFSRISVAFVFAVLVTIFAQVAQASKGPKITNKVFFDIEHGDKPVGRGKYTCTFVDYLCLTGQRYSRPRALWGCMYPSSPVI